MAQMQENGTVRVATREEFSSSPQFRSKPKNIAAIDFGTTHCSLAYQLNVPHITADEKPILLELDQNVPESSRVPSCILFDRDGNRRSFGWEARDEYSKMESAQRPEYIYLEHVKMKLHREESVDRTQKISAFNGKEYFLIDVIAHILCHLKEEMLRSVHDFGLTQHNSLDFDWVISVPAIWKAKGKQMMREAGYKAGLCSVQSPPRLKEAKGFSPVRATSDSPDKLSLALEPESAAIYCRQEAKKTKERSGDRFVPESNNYLVLDIGGGTVDIASHSVTANGIAELAPSNGNDFGGTRVNMEFEKFLADFVEDPNFSCYLDQSEGELYARKRAEMTHLIYSEFETQKVHFGSDANRQSYLIRFPHSFWVTYLDQLKSKTSNDDIKVEDDGNSIRLSSNQMKRFFQPIVKGINDLITSHMTDNQLTDIIDTVYLIGGFGGSSYLRRQIEVNLRHITSNLKMCTLPHASLAVINGAFAFRCDPNVVIKRIADASYGIEYSIPFDPIRHRAEYKKVIRGKRTHFCQHIFGIIVERGEHICTNEVFIATAGKSGAEQQVSKVMMFSTLNQNVMYTTDNGVYKLGEVQLNLDSTAESSPIKLIIDMTHTELHVFAQELESDNKCKLVVDFLSSARP